MLLISMGSYDIKNDKICTYTNNFFLILIFLLIFNMVLPSEIESYLPRLFDISFMWDDWYEALNNDKTNDLYSCYLSFYILNSFEFLCIIYLLLIGSLVCVNMNKFFKNIKNFNYRPFLELFDFFKDSLKTVFMRSQTLVDQTLSQASTRSFSKKK